MKDIQNETHMKFTEFPQFGILSGIKVVVTGINIAGPFAGCMMAETVSYTHLTLPTILRV